MWTMLLLLLLLLTGEYIPRELVDVFPIVLINTDLSTNLPIWFTVSLCAEGCPFSLRLCGDAPLWRKRPNLRNLRNYTEVVGTAGTAALLLAGRHSHLYHLLSCHYGSCFCVLSHVVGCFCDLSY